MAGQVNSKITISRRHLAGALGTFAMPNISRAADRPQIMHGVQFGDVFVDDGMIFLAVRGKKNGFDVAPPVARCRP